MQLSTFENFIINIGREIGIPAHASRWAVPTIFVGGGALIITGIIVAIVYFAAKNQENTIHVDKEESVIEKGEESTKEESVSGKEEESKEERRSSKEVPIVNPPLKTKPKIGLYKPLGSFAVDENANVTYASVLKEGSQTERKIMYKRVFDGDGKPEDKKYNKLFIGKHYPPDSGMPEEFITGRALELLKRNSIIGRVPKYRFLKQKDGLIILSEFIEHSTTIYTKINENGKLNYYDHNKEFIKIIEKSDGFYRTFSLLLLLGDKDPNMSNFLVSEDYPNQLIPIDFGISLHEGINLYQLLYEKGLRKEMFLNDAFLNDLKRTAESFLAQGELYQIILDAVGESAKIVDKVCPDDLLSEESIINTLNCNACLMMDLYWHLQAEKAIVGEDLNLLEEALKNLHKKFPIISQQNYKNGSIEQKNGNFEQFIFSRRIKDCDLLDIHLDSKLLEDIEDNKEKEDIKTYLKNKDIFNKHDRENFPIEQVYYDVSIDIGDDIGAKMMEMVQEWKERISRR